MAHSGKAGLIAAAIAAGTLSSPAWAELELTPVPVIPVERHTALPALGSAPEPASQEAPDDAAAPVDEDDATPDEREASAPEPEDDPDPAPIRRQRREAWAVHCFQENEEVLTVAPLYRVLEIHNGMQDWYYETEQGVRFAGRVGTNVNCYFEPLDAGASRVASVAPSTAADVGPDDGQPPVGFGLLADPDSAEPEEPQVPVRPAWTEPDAAPRPPQVSAQPPAMVEGPWVQLAALPSAGCARAEWRRLGRRFGAALDRYQPMIVRLEQAGQPALYGLRVYPPNRLAAVDLCSVLEAGGQACRLPRGGGSALALAEVAPALSQAPLPVSAIPSVVGFEVQLVATAPEALLRPAAVAMPTEPEGPRDTAAPVEFDLSVGVRALAGPFAEPEAGPEQVPATAPEVAAADAPAPGGAAVPADLDGPAVAEDAGPPAALVEDEAARDAAMPEDPADVAPAAATTLLEDLADLEIAEIAALPEDLAGLDPIESAAPGPSESLADLEPAAGAARPADLPDFVPAADADREIPELRPSLGIPEAVPEMVVAASVDAPTGSPPDAPVQSADAADPFGPTDHPTLALDRELSEAVDLIATRVRRAPGSLVAPLPPAVLQLAVYDRQADAERAWQILSAAHPHLLGGHRPVIERSARANGTPWYRVQLLLPSRATADAMCKQLRDAGDDCWVVE